MRRARHVEGVRFLAARLALGVLFAAAALQSHPALAGGRATCRDLATLASPAGPVAGTALRIVIAGDEGSPGDVIVEDPSGRVVGDGRVAHEGTPWSVVATIARPVAGRYRIALRREGGVDACEGVLVQDAAGPALARSPGGAWTTRLEWSRKMEALYSAWIEHLFDAPLDEDLSFPSLEPVLRDPTRNFLHDHLGLGEDDPGRALAATPDCADLPYLLRAYFAWKLGLGFGFRRCGSGSATEPPRCGNLATNEEGDVPGDPRGAFATFARTVMDAVHSASARTALDDDATDFYPVPLERAAIRPGTIYADPYGHTLVVARWIAQTPERPGLLLAVDAQPDNTVARKRFWEGTFLFVPVASAGPGFKAFRPLVHDEAGGRLRALTDADLANERHFTRWSDVQGTLSPDAFYARMSALVNPRGLEPERAYETTLDALVEQLETRVRSVDNGEQFVREHPRTVIPMPEGAAIFETTGPWEDYATPSRDFRLIIAINVLEGLPARIVRHPELFLLGARTPDAARAEVERLHARRSAERSIEYIRSDGSPWRLTVADVIARKSAFETAYDPNDCIEVRWGAPDAPRGATAGVRESAPPSDSHERSTCRRRAPAEQQARMETYRDWFRESRRPVRGGGGVAERPRSGAIEETARTP